MAGLDRVVRFQVGYRAGHPEEAADRTHAQVQAPDGLGDDPFDGLARGAGAKVQRTALELTVQRPLTRELPGSGIDDTRPDRIR